MISKDISYRPLLAEETLAEPQLDRLHGAWRAAARHDLPGLGFIDPLQLRYLLGSLLVMEVVRNDFGARHYRYRLIGTEIVARRGKDRTGSWLHQHDEALFAEHAVKACDMVVEQRAPVYATLLRRFGNEFHPVIYLLLPLVDDIGVVERILAAQINPPEAPIVPYRVGEAAEVMPVSAAASQVPATQRAIPKFDPSHVRGLLDKLANR